jgi:hypothetical protein
MNRRYILHNLPSIAVILFIAMYSAVLFFKPAFIYNRDGSLRTFGLGFKRKTIIPAWLLAIVLAIVAYLMVLYYVSYPKIVY